MAHQRGNIAEAARGALAAHRTLLESLDQWFATVGVENTIDRGFALVKTGDGKVIVRSVSQVALGDHLLVRLSDGTLKVIVEEK